jgi:predicted 2-oxoglutarate/Fe(II)-dependent dioxygenase YbiX
MHKEELLGERAYVIHDFLTPQECADFIAFSETEGYGDAPLTTARGFVIDKEVRNNTRVMVDDFTLAAMLFERAKPLLPAQFGGWDVVGFNERFRYYRYDVGQTFAPHYDGTFYRKYHEESRLTFMIYLNADFEGGTTEFYRDSGTPKLTVRPESGMALVFEHLQLHEGAPVTSGRKYVLRTDVMYALIAK